MMCGTCSNENAIKGAFIDYMVSRTVHAQYVRSLVTRPAAHSLSMFYTAFEKLRMRSAIGDDVIFMCYP